MTAGYDLKKVINFISASVMWCCLPGAGNRKYDRDSDVSGSEALGIECWELMNTLIENLYDTDEQV